MPSRLCNALNTFMISTNHILKPVIDKFVVIYFDDILIYGNSNVEHLSHLKVVFQSLHDNKLYLNLKKCDFTSPKLIFLSFIINQFGIKTDPIEVYAIKDWQPLRIITKVRSFHGLAIFFKRSIKGFNTITRPIIDYMKKKNFH